MKIINLCSCCSLEGNQIKSFSDILLLAFSSSNTNLLLKRSPYFLPITRKKIGPCVYVQRRYLIYTQN